MKKRALGQIVPYGFSLWNPSAPDCDWRFLVRAPLFIWNLIRYDISADSFLKGWWVCGIIIGFEKLNGIGMRLTVRVGWVPTKRTAVYTRASAIASINRGV